jgi:dihydroorotase
MARAVPALSGGIMRQFIVPLLALTALSSSAVAAQTYDVVIRHVRAMDPETGLDAERTIGIRGGRIAAIGTAPLTGRTIIDGGGLVASPGFIDLHSHAYSYDTAGYQAMDGVTTRLELEIGVFPVKDWFAFKKGHELINYGATVSHTYARQYLQEEAAGKPHIMDQSSAAHRINGDPALIRAPVPDAFYPRLLPLLEEGLKEGALGVGSGTQYAPGITHQEMLDVTRLAARNRACVFTHIRYGSLVEPNSTLEAIQENIANAAITGGCVHIVHINSMAMSSTPAMINLMHDARAHGIDISTEMYPWDASVDQVRSVIFDPGWERRWGVTPHDLQSRATGKRLTQMEFDALRSGTGDDGVLMHMNSEATLETAMKDPLVLFASDSMDIVDDNSHPRSAGTFAHVLGHYVRETKTLALMEALRKMTLQPAQRLETFAPAMKRKGRLQVGADADIDIFDPATVQAGAGYQRAKRYSSGMRWVLVNGRFVVRDGKLVTGVYPGEPVYGGAKR